MVGLFAGQSTTAGAYPPDGEFGNARFSAAKGPARASAARTSGDASRGRTIVFA
jgi:hypothetical protein